MAGDRRRRVVEAVVGEPAWFRGGSYLVFRKIRMRLPEWSLTAIEEQHATIGRHRETGAPLSGGDERSPLDLEAAGAAGRPFVAEDAHARLASRADMCRRSFNYDYGFASAAHDAVAGHGHDHDHDSTGHDRFDAGTLFVALLADQKAFVDVQGRLDDCDRLNTFEHTGSAMFAIPPGARDGGSVGSGLFH